MSGKLLPKKPLVEAIFQFKWSLSKIDNLNTDPHYKLLVGRMFDRISGDYPVHEQLPAASMPDEISAFQVQHRFRTKKGEWPVIQLGPGILTVNQTSGYVWEDFRDRCGTALIKLREAYPDSASLKASELRLQYVNAVSLDHGTYSALDFLKDKMGLSVGFPPKIFSDHGVDPKPARVDIQFGFATPKPKGRLNVRFATGIRTKQKEKALIWESSVHSAGEDVPVSLSSIPDWINEAHQLTEAYFFDLIKGDLEQQFS